MNKFCKRCRCLAVCITNKPHTVFHSEYGALPHLVFGSNKVRCYVMLGYEGDYRDVDFTLEEKQCHSSKQEAQSADG